MVTKEEFDKIALKEKENRLSISRIPSQVKKEFVSFADEEFCSDFGMAFKWCFEQTLEYQQVKKFFFKDKFLEVLKCYVKIVEKK